MHLLGQTWVTAPNQEKQQFPSPFLLQLSLKNAAISLFAETWAERVSQFNIWSMLKWYWLRSEAVFLNVMQGNIAAFLPIWSTSSLEMYKMAFAKCNLQFKSSIWRSIYLMQRRNLPFHPEDLSSTSGVLKTECPDMEQVETVKKQSKTKTKTKSHVGNAGYLDLSQIHASCSLPPSISFWRSWYRKVQLMEPIFCFDPQNKAHSFSFLK